MRKSQWNETTDRQLRNLVDAGKSSTQISEIMWNGEWPTRGAIIGRADRMGLVLKGKPANYRYNEGARPKVHKPPPAKREPTVKAPKLAPVELPVERPPLHVALSDLPDRGCKWPFGDGPFTFCGHPRPLGENYCGWHRRLAYAPVRQDA